jgi:tetratricopeptide (TPR) repeat protein
LALELARRVADRRAESYSLGYLGELYELEERPDDALRLARQAAFVAQQLRAPELLYRWQWQIGRLLDSKGELEAAVRSFQQAISTFEAIRNELAGGLGTRSLLSTFREAVGGMYYDLADAQLRLADHTSEEKQAQKCIAEARQAIELFKTVELVDYFRDRCVDVFRSNIRTVEEVATDAAVVYFIPLRDRTEVLLSNPSGLKRFKVPVGSGRLFSEVRQLRGCLEDRTSHRYRIHAQRLYRWLIDPLEQALAEEPVTTLVFIPDGALRLIPMGALHDGKGFLIERYAVAVAPGMTLVAPRAFAPDRKGVLMCGISEPIAGFSPLVHVRTELDRIEALSGGRRLMDETFRLPRVEEEVSVQPPDVLHIASHGQFSGDA